MFTCCLHMDGLKAKARISFRIRSFKMRAAHPRSDSPGDTVSIENLSFNIC